MGFDDERRLGALSDYRILDTEAESGFDNIVRLAAHIFEVPISLVSLVDKDRQWFKARVGLEASETSRGVSFCDHAIRADRVLVVNDANDDPRFASNALVTGAPHIRFYCGVPVRTPDRQGLGTLCVIDRVPRVVEARELKTLEGLARQVELELELRRRLLLLQDALDAQRAEQRSKELLAAMIVHDMRTPLANVALLGAAIQPADDPSRLDLDTLLEETDRIRRMLNDVLDVCLHQFDKLKPRRSIFDVVSLSASIAARAERLRGDGKTHVTLWPAATLSLDADPELVGRVLENLITNALQHSGDRGEVNLKFFSPAGRVMVQIIDHGTTIPENERTRIFEPLARGSLSPHPGGHGLGLAFCRLAIEAHGGSIRVFANEDGRGNCFEFDLPTTPPSAVT